MANTVQIKTQVDGAKKASGELEQLKSKFTALQKQGAQGLVIGAGAGIAVAGLNAIQGAISGVGDALVESGRAYQEEEVSIARLGQSLNANVKNWDGNTRAIEDLISQREKLGFQDDELRNSLGLLVAATHDVTKAEQIQAVAMDLARFKGISLAEASDALTKVEAGKFRALASLGIVLKAGATQTEALAAVEKVARGQAAAYADTLSGKLAVAAVKAHDAEEKFGKVVTELEATILPAAADALGVVADAFEAVTTAADNGHAPIANIGHDLLQNLPVFDQWAKAGDAVDAAWKKADRKSVV